MGNFTFNVPYTLLGVLLIVWAVTQLGIGSLFGVFALITGIVWVVAGTGLVGHLSR